VRNRGPLCLLLLSFFSTLLWAVSCGRDHSLGVTGSSASSTGAGGGASSSSAESSSGASTSGAGGAGGASEDAGPDPEPSGPTKLTIVNGVNDYDAIRVCFLPYPDGDPALLPWPSEAEGLPFARGAVIAPIFDTIPKGKDIRPVVFAGDLAKIADKTCADALALAAQGPGDAGDGDAGDGGADDGGADGGDAGSSLPPLIAASLAVVPAAVFESPKSILLVPFGCLGGPGHDGPTATLACGFNYSPSAPTVSLIALGMSRKIDKAHLSLQIVNASAALQPSDVRLRSGFDDAKEWNVAPMLALGTIAPSPPFNMIAVKDFGAIDKVLVKTYLPGQAFQSSATLLAEASAHGMLPKTAIANGTGLTLVAVGAFPGLETGAFWHKLTFTLIKADP
jgi:hypothetical protein